MAVAENVRRRVSPGASRYRGTLTWLQSPLGVGLLCLLLAGAADALLRHESGISGDERFYERMAAHPGGPHNFPYAFRVGVPWLVHVLPFSHVTSFTLITLLAVGASGGALYALLREFEVRSGLAMGLAIGFALSPSLLVTLLRHGRSVDPVVVLVLTLGCVFIVRRRQLALAVTLLLGTTVHESCLFLIPLAYAVWAQRPLDGRALLEVARIAFLPIIAYVVLRTSIRAVGAQYIPGYSGPFLDARLDIIQQGLSGADLTQQLRRLVIAYGPLWLIAPVGLISVPFGRRGLALVALCLISMTFAFGWGRVIFFAAPVFYVAAAKMIDHRRRLAVLTLVSLLAFDLGYAIYMQAYGVQHGIDTTVSTSLRTPVY